MLGQILWESEVRIAEAAQPLDPLQRQTSPRPVSGRHAEKSIDHASPLSLRPPLSPVHRRTNLKLGTTESDK
jgi:hypothetical protein